MEKREGELKAAFSAEFERLFPTLFVVQRFASAGSPDRSITGYGRTTHWEFKHGTPDFESLGLQELTCLRLAVAGHCRYVLWQESRQGTGQRTLIVHPKHILQRTSYHVEPEAWINSYDHRWLCEQIAQTHRFITNLTAHRLR